MMESNSISKYEVYIRDALSAIWNGDKFPGSFGPTKDFEIVDYWTLRKRSMQLFKENLYAKGIIRRLLRNEIHTGINCTSSVISSILWPDMSEMDREAKGVIYSELLTQQFNLYAENKLIFDFKQSQTFGDFQEQVRLESLICGDGIIISRINPNTGLPYWEWINGNHIQSPGNYTPRNGNKIVEGVEYNKYGRQVAFHVMNQTDNGIEFERIPCYGEKSGRLISWMVYGSEKLVEETRGEPLLACILYMIKELDRYRDAESRAAVVNAMIPLFIKRSPTSAIGSRPSDGLARLRNEPAPTILNGDVTDDRRPIRDIRSMQPGTIFDDLAPGEEMQSFQTNRPNVNYKAFEEAILSGICWALEVPPEIVMLRFQSNYSASRQANNEFEIYLSYQVKKNARRFCQPIYEEFVIQSCMNGQLDCPGLISAVWDSSQWKIKSAWLSCSWTGLNRPSVDPQKEVESSFKALDVGLTTYDIECRRHSGLSFRQVMQIRKSEEEYMRQLGFTPKANENNNGEPVKSISVPDETE